MIVKIYKYNIISVLAHFLMGFLLLFIINLPHKHYKNSSENFVRMYLSKSKTMNYKDINHFNNIMTKSPIKTHNISTYSDINTLKNRINYYFPIRLVENGSVNNYQISSSKLTDTLSINSNNYSNHLNFSKENDNSKNVKALSREEIIGANNALAKVDLRENIVIKPDEFQNVKNEIKTMLSDKLIIQSLQSMNDKAKIEYDRSIERNSYDIKTLDLPSLAIGSIYSIVKVIEYYKLKK